MAALLGMALILVAQTVDSGDAPGPLAPPPDVAEETVEQPPTPIYTVWDRLAQCESSGRWHIVTRVHFPDGTPVTYFGGLQMDATFWANHGGLDYAPTPAGASREDQIEVAINGRDGRVGRAQGWGAWPYCSRRLGLR